MKVGVVVERIPPTAGGTVTFSQSIVGAIRELEGQSRHEFVLHSAGPTTEPRFKQMPAPEAVPARGLRGAAHSARRRLERGMTTLDRSIQEEDIDLVWFADRHAEPCRIPYIFTVFDIEHLRQPWFPEISVDGSWDGRQAFFSHYIPRATRVIVPNQAGREQVLANYPVDPARIMTLPHPTPAFALRAADHAAPTDVLSAKGIREPYLFYPAQFWPHKNHRTLLEALAELNGDGEGFDLVLAGSDKYGHLAYVRELVAERGLADRVHFLGFVEIDELIALYQNAFALTYMSLFGPENLPPLEAMALGCPVVGADTTGAAEQMGDAALRVPGMDAAAVARAVRSLEQPENRSRLVEAGRARAVGWTATDYVKRVIEFLFEFEPIR